MNIVYLCEQEAVAGKILILGEEQLCAESTAAVKGVREDKGYCAKVQGHGTYLTVSLTRVIETPTPPPKVETWNNMKKKNAARKGQKRHGVFRDPF